MIRLALLCLLLSGCATRVVVLPIVSPMTDQVSCCVAYAFVPPSTDLSVQVTKAPDLKVRLGARWKF
jgi:hypothetical protein